MTKKNFRGYLKGGERRGEKRERQGRRERTERKILFFVHFFRFHLRCGRSGAGRSL
jgi:cell division protein FtsB